MEVRYKEERSDSVCKITFTCTANETEKSRFKRFEAPIVNIGGQFQTFELPNDERKWLSPKFVFSQTFDGKEIGDELAVTRAREYTTEMKLRLAAVLTQFKQISDDFSDDQVYTL